MTKVRNSYYKVTPSYESKHTGYGIGLFLVKKFVALLKGSIQVESELGKGTTFTVMLPFNMGQPKDASETGFGQIDDETETAPLLASKSPLATEIKITSRQNKKSCLIAKENKEIKILLIEDDAVARRVAKFFLQSANFLIEDVENAENALNRIKHNRYDLILTDIGLPGMDGHELAVLTRHWEKKMHHSHLPIIGLSAHTPKQAIKEAKEAGIDMLLNKPLDAQKMNRIVQTFLSDKAALPMPKPESLLPNRNQKRQQD